MSRCYGLIWGSTAYLHVVAAFVARLAAGAFGLAIGADLAIDRVAGVGAAVGALGIGFFLDHELGTVPARLGGRLASGAVLLHEGDLAFAFVVERVVGAQVTLAGRRGQRRARTPVALQERQVLLLLGVIGHHHRLGLVLGRGVLVLLVGLALGILVLTIRALGIALVDVLVVGALARIF